MKLTQKRFKRFLFIRYIHEKLAISTKTGFHHKTLDTGFLFSFLFLQFIFIIMTETWFWLIQQKYQPICNYHRTTMPFNKTPCWSIQTKSDKS